MKKLALIVAALVACTHTHHVDRGDDEQKQAAEEQPAPARQPKKSEGGASAKPRQARRPEKPGRPPLAASPGALFVPGAVEQIQDALANRGYLDDTDKSLKRGDIDALTSAAIRRFQSDEGLARTGNPDHETVRRLGLDAEKVFRKASQDPAVTSPAGR